MRARVLLLSQEVHPVPPLKGAAVEQWIEAVAHRMTRHEAHIVSVPHPLRADEESQDGVYYHRIRMGRLYKRLFRKLTRLDPWSYVDRIAGIARRVGPALLHVHNAPQFVDGLAEALPGIPLLLHMHNEKADPVRSRVAMLAGCSRYVADWYQARQFPARQFTVLDNGVDIGAFTTLPDPVEREKRRRLHGIPEDRFVVLYAGRISPEKGPDLLAQAMSGLDEQRFHLVLAGEWPTGDARTSERVRYAHHLRSLLEPVAHTVLGSMTPGRMPDIYPLADLLVIPSRFEEPFSMVAIEAMAAGVPVLALRRGGMVEYMRDGDNAALLDADAGAADIAKSIMRLAASPEVLHQLARAGRDMVRQRFTWEQVAAQTEALYDRMLGTAP